MPDLTVANLFKRYEDRTVLDGVSLSAQPGDTVAIVGPSGSGKSTLLNIVGSLDRASSGTVRLDDVEVGALDGIALQAYRARSVGFVFQDHHLLPQLTALENVLLPTLALRGGVDPGHYGAKPGVRVRAADLLARMGIQGRADAFPAQMSGGERQRVAVARALINGPGLLLCDEPTGNLDRDSGSEVVSLLLELAAAEGAIVLMVTHNSDHAARFGRRLALAGGRLAGLEAALP